MKTHGSGILFSLLTFSPFLSTALSSEPIGVNWRAIENSDLFPASNNQTYSLPSTLLGQGQEFDEELVSQIKAKLKTCLAQVSSDHGAYLYIEDHTNGNDMAKANDLESHLTKRSNILKTTYKGMKAMPFDQRLQVFTTVVGALTVPLYLVNAGIGFNEWRIMKTKDEALKAAESAIEEKKKKKDGQRFLSTLPPPPPPLPFNTTGPRKRSMEEVVEVFRRGIEVEGPKQKIVKEPNEHVARALALIGASTTVLYLPSGVLGLLRGQDVRDGDTSSYKRSIPDDMEDDLKGFSLTCDPAQVKDGENDQQVPKEDISKKEEQKLENAQVSSSGDSKLGKRSLDSEVESASSHFVKRATIPIMTSDEEMSMSRRDVDKDGNGGGSPPNNGPPNNGPPNNGNGGGNPPKGNNKGNNNGKESGRAEKARLRKEEWEAKNPALIFTTIERHHHVDETAPRRPNGSPSSYSNGQANSLANNNPMETRSDLKVKKKSKIGRKGKMALVLGASTIIAGLAHHLYTSDSSTNAPQYPSYQFDDQQRAAYAAAQQLAYQNQQYPNQRQAGYAYTDGYSRPMKRQVLGDGNVDQVVFGKRQGTVSRDTDDEGSLLNKRDPPSAKKITEMKEVIHHYNVHPDDVKHFIPQVERLVKNNNKGEGNNNKEGGMTLEEEHKLDGRKKKSGKMSTTQWILTALAGLGLGSYASGWYNQHNQQAPAFQQVAQGGPGMGYSGDDGYLVKRDLDNDSLPPVHFMQTGRLMKRTIVSPSSPLVAAQPLPPLPSPSKKDASYGDFLRALREKLDDGLDDEDEEVSNPRSTPPRTVGKVLHTLQKRGLIQYSDEHGDVHFSATQDSNGEDDDDTEDVPVEDEPKAENVSSDNEEVPARRRSIIQFNQDQDGNHLHVTTTLNKNVDKITTEAKNESDQEEDDEEEEEEFIPTRRRESSNIQYSQTKNNVNFSADYPSPAQEQEEKVQEEKVQEKENKAMVNPQEISVAVEYQEEGTMKRREEGADNIDYTNDGKAVHFNANYDLGDEKEDDSNHHATTEETLASQEEEEEEEQPMPKRRNDTKNAMSFFEDKDGGIEISADSVIHHSNPSSTKITMDAKFTPDGNYSVSFKPNDEQSSPKRRNYVTPDR